MIVVSDSSPLITLSKIGFLHLLPSLYQASHITPEVYAEVAVTGTGLSGAAEQHDSTRQAIEGRCCPD